MTARREIPPMPTRTEVHGTVRELGRGHDVAVARVTFEDVTGDLREIDLDERGAMTLAVQLLAFVKQCNWP